MNAALQAVLDSGRISAVVWNGRGDTRTVQIREVEVGNRRDCVGDAN